MIRLIKKHPKIITFGFVVSFFAGFGQTYLLALFNGFIQDEMSISRTIISTIYSVATMASSLLLPGWGRLTDKKSPFTMSIILGLTLSAGFLLLSLSPNIILLFLSYLIIRSAGQAAFSLNGSTAISRSFGRFRGKALAVTSVGRSVAEGILPITVSFLLVWIGWRMSLVFLAISLPLIFIPLSFYLIKKWLPHPPLYKELKELQNSNSEKEHKDWHFAEVAKDYRFYLVAFANTVLPFALTAIFFQQESLREANKWSLELWGSGFTVYAIFQFSFVFLSGHLIDRI
ncbi:MAG: MFS transporter, partial [Bacteriovoracia bacterium]